MIAPRQSGPSTSSPPMASTTGTDTLKAVTLAAGTAGSFQVSTDPRSGSPSPITTMAMMITRNGKPSRAPYCGNQLKSTCILVNDDCTSPIARPVKTTGQMYRNRR